MPVGIQYLQHLEALLTSLLEKEADNIHKGAVFMAEAIASDRVIHVFGTGHSHMVAEEMFYRAGGLACINPILEEGFMLHAGAVKSTALERLPGYAAVLIDEHQCQQGDVLLVASNSGRNTAVVEMALDAKQRGLQVIVVTNLAHSQASASRHPSGKRLFELGDVVIDNQGCIGDAAMDLEGVPTKFAPTSTVLVTAIANALMAETVELLMERGVEPPLFVSSNVDGGEAFNESLIDRYQSRVRSL